MVRNTLTYLLIRHLDISKKEAKVIIGQGKVAINEDSVFENTFFSESDNVFYQGNIIKPAKIFRTLLFYKPVGIETTLNTNISNNLAKVLPEVFRGLYPVGRLDKESEGLLVMTDDGSLYRNTLHYDLSVEKEYVVTVDKIIEEQFLLAMRLGIEIMGKLTKECEVQLIDSQSFRIILTEGRNRQIRRMCYKLGYEVTRLIRIRVGAYRVENAISI